ncbi:MAG: hypothetical protein JWP89_5082 [Schlesneria sp.]|nr:hypothetical protein [Schlesneria sp.]
MVLNLAEVPAAFQLPQLDWQVIRRWIDQKVPQQQHAEAWNDVATQWLESVDTALGNSYQLTRSKHLLLLSPRDYEHTKSLLNFGETGLSQIEASLGNLAGEAQAGPIIVFLAADNSTYGRFVRPHEPEFEHLRSAGVCFQEGYLRIAMRPGPLESLERTFLHELTHACVAHLHLPLWFEEGITQLAEEMAMPHWSRFTLDVATAADIKSYWRDKGLSDFWWGTGFHNLDGQRRNYELAQIVFRLILADHRRQLAAFVREAHVDDAGDSAARKCFGKGVAEFAKQFLGPGDWEPVPVDSSAFCRRGGLRVSRENHEHAMDDFSEAIRIDPLFGDTYVHRGFLHRQLGNYADAIADFEHAIALNPNDFSAMNYLARTLATCPDETFLNGQRAFELSNQACELSGYAYWEFLDTLAATCAQLGDFEDARRWEKEAMEIAPEEERPHCRERQILYKAGQPFRESIKQI